MTDDDWKTARKKPVEIEYREVDGEETIETREGTLKAGDGDYIIRGIEDEVYPIDQDIFEETYERTGTDDATPQSHISEREFTETIVAPWLADHYGADQVREQVHLGASDRFVDFLVETPLATWAVEVENDADAIIGAVGQALLYAAHRPSWRPCVVIPRDHFEQPERDMLDEHVRIVEVPVPDDAGQED